MTIYINITIKDTLMYRKVQCENHMINKNKYSCIK